MALLVDPLSQLNCSFEYLRPMHHWRRTATCISATVSRINQHRIKVTCHISKPNNLQTSSAMSTLAGNIPIPSETNNEYDVIIVGAGMSGLSAAYRILTQRPSTKLLI